MKRKELKDYIRTEIINELSEAGTYAGNKAIDDMKKDPDYNTLSSPTKTDSEKKLKSGGSVTIGESDLDEMARHRKTIKIGDQEKFDEALDLYGTNTIEGKILYTVVRQVLIILNNRQFLTMLNVNLNNSSLNLTNFVIL